MRRITEMNILTSDNSITIANHIRMQLLNHLKGSFPEVDCNVVDYQHRMLKYYSVFATGMLAIQFQMRQPEHNVKLDQHNDVILLETRYQHTQ